mmetsp:Transcript_12163/g.25616  ORF Transcript_12163/g.25616 Transcript_12163/m.25616 type:complete len:210 (-) Transcript_12163:888-1517(-)
MAQHIRPRLGGVLLRSGQRQVRHEGSPLGTDRLSGSGGSPGPLLCPDPEPHLGRGGHDLLFALCAGRRGIHLRHCPLRRSTLHGSHCRHRRGRWQHGSRLLQHWLSTTGLQERLCHHGLFDTGGGLFLALYPHQGTRRHVLRQGRARAADPSRGTLHALQHPEAKVWPGRRRRTKRIRRRRFLVLRFLQQWGRRRRRTRQRKERGQQRG